MILDKIFQNQNTIPKIMSLKAIGIVVFIIFFNSYAKSQINYSLYSVEQTEVVCLSNSENAMYGISYIDNDFKICKYNLLNGDLLQKYSTQLPDNPVKLMVVHPKKSLLYLITGEKTKDSNQPHFDAIYSMNKKSGKLKKIYNVPYNYPIPTRIGIVDNILVFTTLKDQTRVFNLKDATMDILTNNIDYQFVSIAPENNGYIMLNNKKIDKNGVPLYFMNSNAEIVDKVGYVTQNVTIQSDLRKVQLPTLNLMNESDYWVVEAIRYNCFPLAKYQFAMRPFWLREFIALDKSLESSVILAVNEKYMIIKVNNSAVVYNHIEPLENRADSLSDIDKENLNHFMEEISSFQKILITSDIISEVFNAVFYQVRGNHEIKTVGTNSFGVIAQYEGTYIEITAYNQLFTFLLNDFKLHDAESALLFQNTINVLFPANKFNRKYINNYQQDDSWIFVRGEAFNATFGLIVKTNSTGKILSIEYVSDTKF